MEQQKAQRGSEALQGEEIPLPKCGSQKSGEVCYLQEPYTKGQTCAESDGYYSITDSKEAIAVLREGGFRKVRGATTKDGGVRTSGWAKLFRREKKKEEDLVLLGDQHAVSLDAGNRIENIHQFRTVSGKNHLLCKKEVGEKKGNQENIEKKTQVEQKKQGTNLETEKEEWCAQATAMVEDARKSIRRKLPAFPVFPSDGKKRWVQEIRDTTNLMMYEHPNCPREKMWSFVEEEAADLEVRTLFSVAPRGSYSEAMKQLATDHPAGPSARKTIDDARKLTDEFLVKLKKVGCSAKFVAKWKEAEDNSARETVIAEMDN